MLLRIVSVEFEYEYESESESESESEFEFEFEFVFDSFELEFDTATEFSVETASEIVVKNWEFGVCMWLQILNPF